MKRSKKVVFVCHCLLNQSARATGVAKSKGIVKEFVDFCNKRGYGIVQIECMQHYYEPLVRPPANKKIYDNKKFRMICNNIARNTIQQIQMYLKNGYKVEGIYGVEGSPTCAAVRTHKTVDGKTKGVFEAGVFIEELKKELAKESIKIPIYDWDIQAKRRINQ